MIVRRFFALIKKIILPFFLLLLIGCEDNSISVTENRETELETQIEKLVEEKAQLENQISAYEEKVGEEKEALRTNMNLTLQIFNAMNNKDFDS